MDSALVLSNRQNSELSLLLLWFDCCKHVWPLTGSVCFPCYTRVPKSKWEWASSWTERCVDTWTDSEPGQLHQKTHGFPWSNLVFLLSELSSGSLGEKLVHNYNAFFHVHRLKCVHMCFCSHSNRRSYTSMSIHSMPVCVCVCLPLTVSLCKHACVHVMNVYSKCSLS